MARIETDDFPGPPQTKNTRPLWLRVVIGVGVAVLAYYVVGAGLLFALLCIGVPLAIFARYGGMNVLRPEGSVGRELCMPQGSRHQRSYLCGPPGPRLAADLGIGNNGIGISEDPLMPGRHGVSTSAMVGRGLARRQVARSYTLQLRGDGESRTAVLAGGLTEECAGNLERDIRQSIAAFQPAIPA